MEGSVGVLGLNPQTQRKLLALNIGTVFGLGEFTQNSEKMNLGEKLKVHQQIVEKLK